MLCVGSLVRVCFSVAPAADLTLSGTTAIDTDRSTLCDSHNDQAQYCVVVAASLSLAPGGVLRARGTRPLVLLSTGALDLAGTVDVSGHHTLGDTGAGADPAACAVGTTPVNAGGGPGGSFGGQGGKGKSTSGADAAAGPALTRFPALRGGCSGGAGDSLGSRGGPGGSGGGAVALVAGGTLSLRGQINASGGGGSGGIQLATGAGGGGGGSGGMIVLDAPTISSNFTALLFANGGGGGEGGGPSAAGLDGQESSGPRDVASGGIVSANTESGDGASGAAAGVLDGADASDSTCCGGGGGGGGGGAGIIHAPGVGDASTVSPPSRDP